MIRKYLSIAAMPPIPQALKKRVYTQEEIAKQNRQKVDLRRANEDRRSKHAA